jgi:hypothetical protein
MLGSNLQKLLAPSSSAVNVKQSIHSNESEAFDTSDELLDNLVKNAALTTSKDTIKQRRIARHAQRQSCMFLNGNFSFDIYIIFRFSTSDTSNKFE